MLGLAGQAGRLELGARAGLALIDVRGLEWQPRGNVYNHLVMYENGANVRIVLVEGEVVVRDGRCTKVDEADLLAEARDIAAGLERANAPLLAELERDAPLLLGALRAALERPTELNRFTRLT